MIEPMNDLERAYAKALRGAEGNPELFRQLRASMLHFLMPYHPEMDGEIELQNSSSMTFSVWKGDKGEYIPVFTSAERVEAALKAIDAKENAHAVAETNGEVFFRMATNHPYGVVINPACGCGEMYLDRNAVRMLGDGSILEPFEKKPNLEGTIQVVQPADYPTNFIQPLFQFLRGRKEVRAAWLFQYPKATDVKQYFVIGLLVTGNPETVKKDLAVVAEAGRTADTGFGMAVLNPKDPKAANVMAKFPPFYAAPDYRPATPLADGLTNDE